MRKQQAIISWDKKGIAQLWEICFGSVVCSFCPWWLRFCTYTGPTIPNSTQTEHWIYPTKSKSQSFFQDIVDERYPQINCPHRRQKLWDETIHMNRFLSSNDMIGPDPAFADWLWQLVTRFDATELTAACVLVRRVQPFWKYHWYFGIVVCINRLRDQTQPSACIK